MLERGPSQSHLHNSAPSCLTSSLEKARCYKRYTQQVRRKSWRNPKGGILSTEVVFSIFLKKKNLYFSWGGHGRGRGSFHASSAKTEWSHWEVPGVWGTVHLNTVPWDAFLFHFREEFGFKTNRTWMSFRGGLQKSSDLRGLFSAGDRCED